MELHLGVTATFADDANRAGIEACEGEAQKRAERKKKFRHVEAPIFSLIEKD